MRSLSANLGTDTFTIKLYMRQKLNSQFKCYPGTFSNKGDIDDDDDAAAVAPDAAADDDTMCSNTWKFN